MSGFILYFMAQLFGFTDIAMDPVHTPWHGRRDIEQFECERLSQSEAHQRYPGRVPATSPRAITLFDIDALVCGRLIERPVLVEGRDEAILAGLNTDVRELVTLATNDADSSMTWMVDAFYPNPAVVRKVAGAARVSLVENGKNVSDKTPLYTAGDVEVFRTLPMRRAIETSCKLSIDRGLSEDRGVIHLALLDAYESTLHVGVCTFEGFRWLK